jgi:predicted MPP superfamily phosphohydrolase
MSARPRWFGRGQHMGFKTKAVDVILGFLYSGGWPGVVTHAIGLQGDLCIEEHVFKIRRPKPKAAPLRVVYASDFHSGPTLNRSLLDHVIRAIRGARADLILLGGDFVSFHARHVDKLIEPFAQMEAPLGKYAVLGNHDLVGDDVYITRRLTDAGIKVLVNENVRLAAPHDDVWVCGFDDWHEGSPDPDAAFQGATGTRILLAHGPDALTVAGERPFDIAFFGHVHGGQFLFRGKPVISHRGEMSRKHILGGVIEAGANKAPVLISRGIGTSTLPARRGADPQIHICTLLPRDS